MLSEVRQTGKVKDHVISLIRGVKTEHTDKQGKQTKTRGHRQQWVVAGGGNGEGNGVGDSAVGRLDAGWVASTERGTDDASHDYAVGTRTVLLTSVTPVHPVKVEKLQTEEK